MEFPNLSDATEKVKAEARGRLIPWLPHHECPKCNTVCKAGQRYDPKTAAFHSETNGKVPAWICPDCDSAYRREEDSLSANLWG